MSVFPNQGLRRRPFLIDRIIDKAGNVIYQTPVLESEVITPSVAHMMRLILAQVHGSRHRRLPAQRIRLQGTRWRQDRHDE
jgi:membrane peptidoglycan carboxypeptidase